MDEKHHKILSDPNLFTRITEKEMDKKIVGEFDSRKTIFLCCCGSLVKNARMTSFNLLVNSESGAGKDWVSSNAILIMPKGSWIKRTRISPNLFNYWHNAKYEPDWSWDGKVLYLEDVSNNILNHEVFKTMCSSGSKATILINQTPVDLEIKGKPVVIITSASATPENELLRRFTILNLDETVDQTKEINKRQAEFAEKGFLNVYDVNLIGALSKLERVEVKIPFAKKLTELLPTDHIIMRTAFDRFLDYIKASAALHQFQRKFDAQDYVLAEGQDYDIARIALLKTTSNKRMIPLTKNQKRILEIFEQKLEKRSYSFGELEPYITFLSDRQLRRECDKLANYDFLQKDREEREESRRMVTVYSYLNKMMVDIPTWDMLQDSVKSVSNVKYVNTVKSVNEKLCSDINDRLDNENCEAYSDSNINNNGNIEPEKVDWTEEDSHEN